MICRKCSAEIDDDCEVCPFCASSVKMPRKFLSLSTVVIVILCAVLVGSLIFNSMRYDKLQSYYYQDAATELEVTAVYAEDTVTTTAQETSQINYASALSEALIFVHGLNNVTDNLYVEYAKAYVTKDALTSAGTDEINDFYNAKVAASNYAWVSIICEDETGLVLYPGNASFASYGSLNELGLIDGEVDVITLSQDAVFSSSVYSVGAIFGGEAAAVVSSSSNETTSLPVLASTAPATTSAHATSTYPKTSSAAETSASTTEKRSTSAHTTEHVNEYSSTVYITNSGSKYHLGSCSYLSKSKIAISRSDAIAQGYEPCSRCKP